jgi:sugar phosphate isomerase/epimerase
MAKPVIGVQMYTLRDSAKTLPEIEASFEKVAKIGYKTVQLSGMGPVSPREMARALQNAGLVAAATHEPWSRFQNELETLIETHKLWGCSHLAIGGLPGEYLCEEGVDRFVDELAPVAARLAQEGMDFSYHNHNHELARFGGRTWLARLYEKAPGSMLKAELDTYWLQAGGGDPAAWIRQCAGREPVLHLKDMIITAERELRMAEVGEGNLNWPAILTAAEEGGAEYLMVEQDRCYERDPFESVAISYRNLKAMGYA